jgi:hypothetical protein
MFIALFFNVQSDVLNNVSQAVAKQFSAAYIASNFKQLNFNQCNITDIDPQFPAVMTQLEDLCITGNKLTKLNNLPPNIKTVNAYGNEITNIDVGKNLKHLHSIGVGYNHISDLSFVTITPLLLSLDLSYNDIVDLKNSVLAIKQLKHLKILSLHGNCICLLSHYRSSILANIQNLISLDDSSVSLEEKKNSISIFNGFPQESFSVKITVHTVNGLEVDKEEEEQLGSRQGSPTKLQGKQTPVPKQPPKKEAPKGKKGKEEVVAPPEPVIKERVSYSVEYRFPTMGEGLVLYSTPQVKSSQGVASFNHEQTFNYDCSTLSLRDHLLSKSTSKLTNCRTNGYCCDQNNSKGVCT